MAIASKPAALSSAATGASSSGGSAMTTACRAKGYSCCLVRASRTLGWITTPARGRGRSRGWFRRPTRRPWLRSRGGSGWRRGATTSSPWLTVKRNSPSGPDETPTDWTPARRPRWRLKLAMRATLTRPDHDDGGGLGRGGGTVLVIGVRGHESGKTRGERVVGDDRDLLALAGGIGGCRGLGLGCREVSREAEGSEPGRRRPSAAVSTEASASGGGLRLGDGFGLGGGSVGSVTVSVGEVVRGVRGPLLDGARRLPRVSCATSAPTSGSARTSASAAASGRASTSGWRATSATPSVTRLVDVGAGEDGLERRRLGQGLGHRGEPRRILLAEQLLEEAGHLGLEAGDAGLDVLDLVLDAGGMLLDLVLESALRTADPPLGLLADAGDLGLGPLADARRCRRRPAPRRSAASSAERSWISSTKVFASAWNWSSSARAPTRRRPASPSSGRPGTCSACASGSLRAVAVSVSAGDTVPWPPASVRRIVGLPGHGDTVFCRREAIGRRSSGGFGLLAGVASVGGLSARVGAIGLPSAIGGVGRCAGLIGVRAPREPEPGIRVGRRHVDRDPLRSGRCRRAPGRDGMIGSGGGVRWSPLEVPRSRPVVPAGPLWYRSVPAGSGASDVSAYRALVRSSGSPPRPSADRRARAIARRVRRAAGSADTPRPGRSATSGSRSPTAATSAARTACPRRSSGATSRSCRGPQVLTFEEIERLARVFVALGVEKLRITGGEPLRAARPARAHRACSRALRTLDGGPVELTLTTNGSALRALAAPARGGRPGAGHRQPGLARRRGVRAG